MAKKELQPRSEVPEPVPPVHENDNRIPGQCRSRGIACRTRVNATKTLAGDDRATSTLPLSHPGFIRVFFVAFTLRFWRGLFTLIQNTMNSSSP